MVAGDRIDSLRRLVEIWNSADVEGLLEALPPEFEFTTDPSFPDAGTYRGDEVGPWMRDWARSWQENKPRLLVRSRRAALADSPVKRCMLCSTRLGCLKKPTKEA